MILLVGDPKSDQERVQNVLQMIPIIYREHTLDLIWGATGLFKKKLCHYVCRK